MRYLLLLRGVNVGGRNGVSMPALRQWLERAGFLRTQTYLNSGNVLMDADCPRDEAALRVRATLNNHCAFDVPFALLTAEAFGRELEALPRWWSEPLARRDALFPVEGTDFDAVRADIASLPLGDEVVHFGERAILWGKRDERTYGRTAYHRLLIKRPCYRRLTIRNGNTFDWIASHL